jgi:type II secretory pathway pseudopilin PulG
MTLISAIPVLRHRFRRRAFTIVEILLAMGIFSMVLVSIYSTWSAIVRGSKSAQVAAAAVQRSRVSVRAIEDAINTAQLYAGNDELYWFLADTKGEFASLSFVARLPESFPGGGLYPEPQRLRYVMFQVERGEFSDNQLMLKQCPLLRPRVGGELVTDDTVLSPNVDLFKIDFFDATKKDWLDEWKLTNAFPALVRVSIGMGNKPGTPEEKKVIITRIMAPSCIVVPLDAQMLGNPGLRGAQPVGSPANVPGLDPNDPRMLPGGFNPGIRR